MIRPRPPFCSALVQLLLTAVLAFCGCAQTAKVSCWRPADVDLQGLQRVTVLDFVGDPHQRVSDTLTDRLLQTSQFSLVDRSQLAEEVRTASFDSTSVTEDARGLERSLQSAQRAGVDAAIVGEVVTFSCEDLPAETTGRPSVSRVFAPVRHDALIRHAEVAVTFNLLDVRTGEIVCRRTLSRKHAQSIQPGADDFLRQEELLAGLLDECVADFVETLIPQKTPVEIELADCDWIQPGCAALRRGNKLARTGRWTDAQAAWTDALERDSQNDAALFNLAVAALHKEDFEQAEDFAMQAVRLRPTECYIQGLDQIRRQQKDFEKTREQQDSSLVTQASR